MESLEIITNIVSSIFICVGVAVAIWQLREMKKGFKADHERRKKQATIEFYFSICKEYDKSLKIINEQFSNGEVINVNDFEKDKGLQNAMREYLTHIENLSVGINTGIYDIFVFERMSGVYTTKLFYRFREFIEHLRKNHNPVAYKDFEILVSKLKDLRAKRFSMDNVDFAKIKHDFE